MARQNGELVRKPSWEISSFLLSQNMESVYLWPHLGTCLHANPWVVRRNLEEGRDKMLSAMSVVGRIIAKKSESKCSSRSMFTFTLQHGWRAVWRKVHSTDAYAHMHVSMLRCIRHLWECLKTGAIFLEVGSKDWGSRGWEVKGTFLCMLFPTFCILCVFKK